MTATARHEQAENNRRHVRELLKHRQPSFAATLEAIELALSRELGPVGCQPVDGEPPPAARARWFAASSAIEAVTAIRDGDMTGARALLNEALTYLDTRDARMEAAT